jgi:hypothetical protein
MFVYKKIYYDLKTLIPYTISLPNKVSFKEERLH